MSKRVYRSRLIRTHLNNVIFVIDDPTKIVTKIINVDVTLVNVTTVFESKDDRIDLSKRLEFGSRLICYQITLIKIERL